MPRYHALDALRATMMLLGLVLHSAASYMQTPLGWVWPYHDASRSLAFDLLVFFIHLFRMPVFFIVAGFFAALLDARDGRHGFVRNRLRRVLLPLCIFWALTVPLGGLGFVVAAARVGAPMPWELMPQMSLLEQPILGHLWFLYDLLIFYAAAVLVVPAADRLPRGVRQRAGQWCTRLVRPTAVLPLATITAITLLPMEVPGLETSAAVAPPLRVLAAYGVFFAFGWLLHARRDTLPAFAASWKWTLPAGAAASASYLAVVAGQPIPDPVLWHVVAVSLNALSVWLIAFGLIGVFMRYMATATPAGRYLSDASYWMYLTHLVPITWTAALLATAAMPAVVKFGIVFGVTTALTVVSYHVAVRSTVVGELLNGRRYQRALPRAEAAV